MRAEGECGRDATESWRQLCDHTTPHAVVHQHAMQQHHSGAFAAGVEVVNWPGRQIDRAGSGVGRHRYSLCSARLLRKVVPNANKPGRMAVVPDYFRNYTAE